jgi:hypothetical protein
VYAKEMQKHEPASEMYGKLIQLEARLEVDHVIMILYYLKMNLKQLKLL